GRRAGAQPRIPARNRRLPHNQNLQHKSGQSREMTMRHTSERNVVTVRGLRKTYGTRTVVAGLDLDVRAGEIVGLVGANGAGKTRTVEGIQGLRQPGDGGLNVPRSHPPPPTPRP